MRQTAGERTAAKKAAKEEVIAGWIERVGFAASALAALILTGVLAGDVAALIFDDPLAPWQLAFLRAGPVMALVLGAIGGYATWYHWLRLIVRLVARRERPNVRKEAQGIVEDRALDLPGQADDTLRQHARELRGCRSRLQGCQVRVALLIFATAVVVTVATLGPAPLRALALPQTARGGGGLGPGLGPGPGGAPLGPTFAPPRGQLSAGSFRAVTPTVLSGQSGPTSIAVAPDGSLWATAASTANQVSELTRIAPDGTVTRFQLPTPSASATGITLGPDGNLWFVEDGVPVNDPTVGHTVPDGAIGRITPSGAISEFVLPLPDPNSGFPGNATPDGITAGPDGNLWFTEDFGGPGAIGRITPSGAITTFPIGTSFSTSSAITSAPDGTIWFTGLGNTLGHITTGGAVTLTPLAGLQSAPEAIAAGSDGAIWFTEQLSVTQAPSMIGRIDAAGNVREVALPLGPLQPAALTTGPDGNLWLAIPGVGSVLRYAQDGALTLFNVANDGWRPDTLAFAPDGTLWVGTSPSEVSPSGDGRVYRITP